MNNQEILDLILKRKEIISKSSQAEKDFFNKVQESAKDFYDLLSELQMQQIQINTEIYGIFCSQFVRFDGSVTILITSKEGGKILIRDVNVSMLPAKETTTQSRKKKKEEEPKKEPFVEATLAGYNSLSSESKSGFLDIISKIIRDKKTFLQLERDAIKSFYEEQVKSQGSLLESWNARLESIK